MVWDIQNKTKKDELREIEICQDIFDRSEET